MTTPTATIAAPANIDALINAAAASDAGAPADAITAIVAHHRAESWRSLAQVDALLEQGELEAAAQALWESAAHGVRAAAAYRRRPYATTWDLGQVINYLIDREGGAIDLNTNFFIAHSFDRIDRAWEIPLFEGDIVYARGPVTDFLKMMEAMD